MKIDRVQGHSFVSDVIDDRSVVVDLGMNKGSFSAKMRGKYKCGILGVEANPKLARDLVEQDVQCLNAAISSSSGFVEFFVNAGDSEASSLTPVQTAELECVKIQAITLADLLAQRDVREVDLLKIDIEGAEVDLLLHCDPEVLGRVKQICVEFHIFLYGEHRSLVEDIVRRMHAIGFHVVDFSRNFEDVLFINKRFVPLSAFDRLLISAQKYGFGLGRMMRRRMSGAH